MSRDPLKAAIKAIVTGGHRDPFGVLGPHPSKKKGKMSVRAFLPWAAKVSVVPEEGEAVEMDKVHDDGFFVVEINGKPLEQAYRFRVDPHHGETIEVEDPYRFPARIGEMDLYLLAEGTHLNSHEKLGAHPVEHCGVHGTYFAVWAPNAKRVSVVGNFNGWDGRQHPMRNHPSAGIWEIFLPHVGEGDQYKFEIVGPDGNLVSLKTDPYAFYCEVPPKTASVVRGIKPYDWQDADWMADRHSAHERSAPISIYECHLGSWKTKENGEGLTYRELADELVAYVQDMGFTHIELMPINEHPFAGSWGYQPIGLFAPTSRFGTPEDFCYFIDRCHQAGVGVVLDWVPGHFPEDAHGLGWFDGTHLYEHQDPRKGRHMDWGTLIYNFGRTEVQNYLLANALFWLERFHLDGLRVDAVASMLYLDYSREAGQWIPNEHGGNENLEAISFIKRLNELVYGNHPGVFTAAEESTAWPMVSRPVYLGGLGFGYKWNMGWMNDTLRYIAEDPVHRKYHHDKLTFGLLYAFNENFILPLSHDEVVHGKRSILHRMPGDDWQKFANLRAYYTFMWGHPGKKLLFMGSEFAQGNEWDYAKGLDWWVLQYDGHKGVQNMVRDLNKVYRDTPALHQLDCDGSGFAWIDCDDRDHSTLSFLRFGEDADDFALVVLNFTPVARKKFRIGVPQDGAYKEIFNSDSAFYGGTDSGNAGLVMAEEIETHGYGQSVSLTLPPLSGIILVPQKD